MNQVSDIKARLRSLITISQKKQSFFFKTGVGHYAEHDVFLHIKVPAIRTLAKEFQNLSLDFIQEFMDSPFNEERLLALVIIVNQYKQANVQKKDVLYNFYLRNIKQVNNWNLVDISAHLIIGAHLYTRDKRVLIKLARSKNMWERRIAILSTWYFIRKNQLAWTFKIATLLLHDAHDLIHKAVGWMLREAGKRDQKVLKVFLDQYVYIMPRTTLRYAIEKFSEAERKDYLLSKKLIGKKQ